MIRLKNEGGQLADQSPGRLRKKIKAPGIPKGPVEGYRELSGNGGFNHSKGTKSPHNPSYKELKQSY
jgi:hypothetical protein